MSDAVLTSDSAEVGGAPGTAETIAPAQEPGQGSAAPERNPEAGSSQDRTEDGQTTQVRRGRTMKDDLIELRQWRREARQRETGYQSELQALREELANLRSSVAPQPGKNARNPAEFWQDPQAALERSLEDRLMQLEERLMGNLQNVREMDAASAALRQEQGSAVEFIRSQSTYSHEDDEDLIDIIESIPNRESLSPQFVAEYAWMKLQSMRGVGDRTEAKRRASTVVGQPPGVSLGQKTWSKAEFDNTIELLEKQGSKADQKLLDELYAAAREGRVR